MSRFFAKQGEALIDGLDTHLATKTPTDPFDFNAWANEFVNDTIGEISKVVGAGVDDGFTTAAVNPLTVTSNRDINYSVIAKQVLKSELVNKKTGKDVAKLLEDMIRENRTQAEMKQELRKFFKGIEEYRVDRVVNTVVVGAYEAGRLEAWKAAGIKKKVWVSTADGRVREDHDARIHPDLDTPIPIRRLFSVGGAKLRHPGDPKGPKSQIINCRCTMAPHVD